MELIAAATIWGLFSCYLLFPLLGFPPAMHRTAMALLVGELLALGFWSYGSEGCRARPCAAVAEAGRTAASVDIPLLAVALVLLVAVRTARIARASARAPDRPRRPGPQAALARARQLARPDRVRERPADRARDGHPDPDDRARS